MLTMDLILWRHAEAEVGTEHMNDLARPLTARGEKQAEAPFPDSRRRQGRRSRPRGLLALGGQHDQGERRTRLHHAGRPAG